ncbi:MAG: hypothetical protein IJE78_10255 [Bacteroidaceae bacterium]|nr:hypothetical protein [Bacteroidaceae bacterium]
MDEYLFATSYKDTKESIHFQIVSVVSLLNDDDSGMDADDNGFLTRRKEVLRPI